MIGVGILGYGYWGPNLARNFDHGDRSFVAAIADGRAERRALAAKRHPTARVVADLQEMLADPRVGAVVIALPVAGHFEAALAALRAGRHVLVEKPLTTTVDQAQRLIEEAGRRSLTLMVDHTFVYSGAVRKVKELTAELGRLYYYDSVRANLGIIQQDVNVLWDLAVHDLSILAHLVPEPPQAVSCIGSAHVPGYGETMAYLNLFFASGAIGHVHVNWLSPVKIRRTMMGGDRRMVIYDDMQADEKVKLYDKGLLPCQDGLPLQQRIGYRSGDVCAPEFDRGEPLARMAEHFAACALDGGEPLTGGLAGLQVARLLEAAHRSMAQRGHPVELS